MKQLTLLLALAAVLGGCSAKKKVVHTEDNQTELHTMEAVRDSSYKTYQVDSSYCESEDVEFTKVVYKTDTAPSGKQLVDYTITITKASQKGSKVAKTETTEEVHTEAAVKDSVGKSEVVVVDKKSADSGSTKFVLWLLLILAAVLAVAYIKRKISE